MALELVVVTPEGEALSETVEQVVLPGEAGEFGVLESHERFLTPLSPGPMQIVRGGANREWAAISSGFAEVDGAHVVVLVDRCRRASEIDHAETEARRVEAADALAALPEDEEHAGERLRLAGVVATAELELDVVGR
ncbi:MAG: ATP synthase F1 subunit epsilon [Spirochaetaceae bacterium]|nr:ATP synthase F1 subunit epsilon [Myxococcales bacterium]MCB9723964.1 ATP synthase F1 subunit epsilon [Spirochaetaceae bacterium]HPG25356.1 ATP synthase F1 subunit epsilon [Myxococcota bacterium]